VPPESFVEIPGLRVEVEEVIYQPNLDAPENRPHPFVYFISIINGSMETVTIRGRKWVLRGGEERRRRGGRGREKRKRGREK